MSYPKQVLVVGYYDHFNLGDEQYKLTIPYVLNRVFYKSMVLPRITFIDCDQLASFPVDTSTTMVLLGGGDVLNTYFLDKFYTKFAENRPISLVAFSVGIPYNDVYLRPELRNKLDIFDHIFLRTKQDVLSLQQALSSKANNVHYLPDTSCFVLEHIAATTQFKQALTHPFRATFQQIQVWGKTRKIIGVMLCRHMYHPDSPYKEQYQEMVIQLARMMEALIRQNYVMVLVPFNTKATPKGSSSALNKENDVLMQRDVMKQIQPIYQSSICTFEMGVTTEQTMLLYKQFYLTIPMRFHATLFSVYAGVPMIPIYTTKKIKNFLLDIGWSHEYVLEKNAKDLPVRFDAEQWLTLFDTLTYPATYLAGKKRLSAAYQEFKRVTLEHTALVRTCMETQTIVAVTSEKWKHVVEEYEANMCLFPLNYPESPLPLLLTPPPPPPPQSPPDFLPQEPVSPLPPMLQMIYDKLQKLAREHGGTKDFRNIRDKSWQEVAVSVVTYYLTHQLDSPYHHGLMSKMFAPTYDYRSEWTWILDQEHKQTPLDVIESTRASPNNMFPSYPMRFNLKYIDQNDQSGAHRSGWKYVYDAIEPYHSDASAHLLLDLYVDRTFHWKRDIYREIDIIPYTRPWVGFIHHTFDTEFSEYNNENLLKCPEFIQSLVHCRGLIVLTKTLQTQFLEHFQVSLRDTCVSLSHPVPVFAMTHPTETNVPTFQYSAFLNNPDKKLLHVGGWLRNIFSFYQLNVDTSFSVLVPQPPITVPVKISFPAPAPIPAPLTELPPPPRLSIWTKYFGCCFAKSEPLPLPLPLPLQLPPQEPYEPFVEPSSNIVPTTQVIRLRKVILKGKNMDNYFPQTHHFEKAGETTEEKEEEGYCSSDNRNNWWKHMMKYVHHVYTNNVDVMEYVDNVAYDELITQNLVFLNLVDGAAVNTLIECVVRNTPILVNRHPAVVEVLGDNYPLYYDENTDLSRMDEWLSASPDRIYQSHVYLSQLDKTPFHIDTFVQHLNKLFQSFPQVVRNERN